jgi:hypothetical protein
VFALWRSVKVCSGYAELHCLLRNKSNTWRCVCSCVKFSTSENENRNALPLNFLPLNGGVVARNLIRSRPLCFF